MNSNNIDKSLPPKEVLEQYVNEVSGIISRIESSLFLLERQTTLNDSGKRTKENIESLLEAMKRTTQLAEEYLQND